MPNRQMGEAFYEDHPLTVVARIRNWNIFGPDLDFLAAHESLSVRSLVAATVGLHQYFADEAWIFRVALPYFKGESVPDVYLDGPLLIEPSKVEALESFLRRLSVALSGIRAGTLRSTGDGSGGPETSPEAFLAFGTRKRWELPGRLTGKSSSEDSALKALAPAPAVPNVTRHTTKQRVGALDAIIELARAGAVDSTDWQSVWASLVRLAEGPTRPAPLIGYVDDEGVKYLAGGEDAVKTLSRGAFCKRFKR